MLYRDDILVSSSNFNEHLKYLGEVFQRPMEAKLTLKPSKCNFAVEKVVYLGHMITKEGVSVDNEKTLDKFHSFPTPSTQKQLKSVICLCNY